MTTFNPPSFQPRGSHPPTSNTHRQREFRARNPGYYGRLHRRRKAEQMARLAALRAAEAEAIAVSALAARALPAPALPVRCQSLLPAPVAQRQVLMLPAPVERIEIPGMNVIPRAPAIRAASPIEVSVRVAIPSADATSLAA